MILLGVSMVTSSERSSNKAGLSNWLRDCASFLAPKNGSPSKSKASCSAAQHQAKNMRKNKQLYNCSSVLLLNDHDDARSLRSLEKPKSLGLRTVHQLKLPVLNFGEAAVFV